jgi:hypothetical protein
MTEARLPDARRADVAASIELRFESGQLFCTCDITGSTKERDWDGSPADAEALVDDLADETASFVSKTPHYAWLRTSR